MRQLQNNQKITCITMNPVAHTRCVIGGDWYRNDFTILFYPKYSYPDYTELQEWIMTNLDGQDLNIEDAVDMLFEELLWYDPKALKVIDRVADCKTHFPVTVERSLI